MAVVLSVGLVLILCNLTGVFPPERRGGRSPCLNNLRQINLALAQYESAHKTFPPAFIVDEQGRPMHSWRVLILPYLGEQQLYDEYRFNEPWNGPHNSQLAQRCPEVFRCPKDVERYGRKNAGMTSYAAVIGSETAWPGAQSTRSRDMSDGTYFTILLVEVADSGINWMEPRDLHLADMPLMINSPNGKGISSAHRDMANVAMADGSARPISDSLSPEMVRALLTRNGGETIGEF